MSASERLKAASGDYSRVCKQTVPAAVAFSLPSAFPPSEPSRESPCGVKKSTRCRNVFIFIISFAANGGTTNPHSRLTRKKRGRRLLVLLAPKVQEKKVCENCNLPETSRTFSVKFRKTFFPAFRWRKAAKATRPIPMSASGRLKAASGDYPRVCKQTVPAAVAFSPPSASPPSEPSRDLPIGKGEVME